MGTLFLWEQNKKYTIEISIMNMIMLKHCETILFKSVKLCYALQKTEGSISIQSGNSFISPVSIRFLTLREKREVL